VGGDRGQQRYSGKRDRRDCEGVRGVSDAGVGGEAEVERAEGGD
jgi:hypothetical protein